MPEAFFSDNGLLFSSDKSSGISLSMLDFRLWEYLVDTVLDEFILLVLLAACEPRPNLLFMGFGMPPVAAEPCLLKF